MKIIYISEQYIPVTSGITTYVKNIVERINLTNHEIELVVPGIHSEGEIQTSYINNLKIVSIGVGCNFKQDFIRSKRLNFCSNINLYLYDKYNKIQIDVIHILFGPYLIKEIDAKYMKTQKTKLFVSVHNLPPYECSVSWKEDNIFRYVKDSLRKIGVKYVNKNRITKHSFDGYFVMSSVVEKLLGEYVDKSKITVTHLGGRDRIKARSIKNNMLIGSCFNILTVGGIVIHKNQHLLPEIAVLLRDKGVNFQWRIIGPIRNLRYFNFIKDKIKAYDLTQIMTIENDVPFEVLDKAYTKSHIYVQPSSEEGFCMTTLDAGIYGIPIVGTNAGAIKAIVENSKGILVEPNIKDIFNAVLNICSNYNLYKSDKRIIDNLVKSFNWSDNVDKLLHKYKSK